MNYTKQIIIAASTLAFSLPSCTNEALIDNRLLGKELVVSAEIVSSATQQESRASDALGAVGASSYDKTSFFDADQIKISKKGGTESTGVLYQKSGTRWLPVSGEIPLTVSSGEETFTGVYPHDFSMICSDQTDNGSNSGDNFKKSNKLMAEKTITSGNSINFKFAPAFCKMTVTITFQDERSNVTATLTGTNICTENNKTGSINLLRTSSNDAASKQHSFICIFNPGTYATHSLTITSTDNENKSITNSYTYKNNGNSSETSKTFEKCKNYIYNFTSTNHLILTDIKVVDFEPGSTNDVGSAT